jgi:hypothetical protein
MYETCSLETTEAEAVSWACTSLDHPFSIHLHIQGFILAISKLLLH